jgi:hypothetical protein
MNRRSFFKMFGGAIAAAALPMGALALSRFASLSGAHTGVDIDFGYNVNLGLDDFEKRILEPAMQRIAEKLDQQIMELMK